MEYKTEKDVEKLIIKNIEKYVSHETYMTSEALLIQVLKKHNIKITDSQLEKLEIKHGSDHYNENCSYYESNNIYRVFETLEEMKDEDGHKIINKRKINYDKLIDDIDKAGDLILRAYQNIDNSHLWC